MEHTDDTHHVYCLGTVTYQRDDMDEPASVPAKLCGCGQLLVQTREGEWCQPAVFDWDGKLDTIECYFRVGEDENLAGPEEELQTSTGPGGSSQHVPGTG